MSSIKGEAEFTAAAHGLEVVEDVIITKEYDSEGRLTSERRTVLRKPSAVSRKAAPAPGYIWDPKLPDSSPGYTPPNFYEPPQPLQQWWSSQQLNTNDFPLTKITNS